MWRPGSGAAPGSAWQPLRCARRAPPGGRATPAITPGLVGTRGPPGLPAAAAWPAGRRRPQRRASGPRSETPAAGAQRPLGAVPGLELPPRSVVPGGPPVRLATQGDPARLPLGRLFLPQGHRLVVLSPAGVTDQEVPAPAQRPYNSSPPGTSSPSARPTSSQVRNNPDIVPLRLRRRTTQLSSRRGWVSYEPGEADMPRRSGAAPGSSSSRQGVPNGSNTTGPCTSPDPQAPSSAASTRHCGQNRCHASTYRGAGTRMPETGRPHGPPHTTQTTARPDCG